MACHCYPVQSWQNRPTKSRSPTENLFLVSILHFDGEYNTLPKPSHLTIISNMRFDLENPAPVFAKLPPCFSISVQGTDDKKRPYLHPHTAYFKRVFPYVVIRNMGVVHCCPIAIEAYCPHLTIIVPQSSCASQPQSARHILRTLDSPSKIRDMRLSCTVPNAREGVFPRSGGAVQLLQIPTHHHEGKQNSSTRWS